MIEEPVASVKAAKQDESQGDGRYMADKNGVEKVEGPPRGILGAPMIGSSDENGHYSNTPQRRKKKSRPGDKVPRRQNTDSKKEGVLYTIKSRGKVYHQWENPLLDKQNDNERSTDAIIEIFFEKSGKYLGFATKKTTQLFIMQIISCFQAVTIKVYHKEEKLT